MNLNQYDTRMRVQCTLIESKRITAEESAQEVKELKLDVDVSETGAIYDAGQVIGVLVPGPHPMGNEFHFRLYTIADLSVQGRGSKSTLTIMVRRCNYIDEYSGEEFQGIASNYLCDLAPGEQLLVTGPFGYPFEQPDDKDADIIMIGMGTGIAPFRAFVKMLYRDREKHNYKVQLFYGTHTGLEILYMNDRKKNLADYFDTKTFEAIQALSPSSFSIDKGLEEHSQEVWQQICSHKTYVYIAGIADIGHMLDQSFSKIAGSVEKWQRRKAELLAGKRWVELIY